MTLAAQLEERKEWETDRMVADAPLSQGPTTPAERINEAFHELLDADTRPVPACFRRDAPLGEGATKVPVERYISKEIHDLEVEKIWKRTWQVACHEDDIPNIGDYIPYDIVGLSFLIVRTQTDQFKAFYNACLHRGRKLRESPGRSAKEFKCPYHGWTWSLMGRLTQVPCLWDFPGLKREEQSLPEVSVGRWGGFVFINPDPNCEPLETFLGDLPTHFPTLPYERRYKAVHVAKMLRCNWKVAQEAFMEAYHVSATHPQILIGDADAADTKFDAFENYSRAIRCGKLMGEELPQWESLPSDGARRVRHPLNGWVYEARDDGLVKVTTPSGEMGLYTARADHVQGGLGDANPHLCLLVAGRQLPPEAVPPVSMPSLAGKTRAELAEIRRDALRSIVPSIADQIADIEFATIYFTVFPNFHPWGSFSSIVYRFRPNGNCHEESIMECMYLAPIPENGPKPPTPPIHWLSPDDDWTEAPELGPLALVFNQDVRNLPYVQQGLHATAKTQLQFAHYAETKIRHFHLIWERKMAAP